MWSSIWQYFGKVLGCYLHLTTFHLETDNTTTIYTENLICEVGEVVGKTAVIDVKNGRVTKTPGKLPSGMQRSFRYKRSILDAGNNTVFLNVEVHLPDGRKNFINGTAFFVAEKLLITAGHNVVSEQGSIGKIRITYKGLKVVDLSECATIECNIVGILYDPSNLSKDLAVLECPTLSSPSFLRLSTDILPVDAIVHVIGYPGNIRDKWLQEAHGRLNDYRASKKASEVLLPPRTLTVTEGAIEQIYDGSAWYKLSTSQGMSGGCLLHEGKVYGVHVGSSVHVGHIPNTATLFRDAAVREFLIENGIGQVIETPLGDFELIY